jgi:Lipopolysaccharide kinase (Kdo/WaaP) family
LIDAMRPKSQMEWRQDPEFARLELGRSVMLIHRGILDHAAAIAARLSVLKSQVGAGNRKSGFRLSLESGMELFARRSTRGGFVRHLVSRTFIGVEPRPFRELVVAAEARRRGVPVAEPMGAMVEWMMPGIYRGFFITRALPGMTLWEFMRTDDDPAVREHVLIKTRAAIVTMHERGVLHADLNVHNLMVTQAGESFSVVILDLDKARLVDHAVAAGGRRANARRLLRSARKLDPAGKIFDARALKIIDVG